MMGERKSYSEYRDSGQLWLGIVPAHWDVLPNRALFTEVRVREQPDAEMLSVTITRGVVRQASLLAESSKKDSSNQDRSAYKVVQPGDIVYNKMRAWQGALGASQYNGIVSPAYVVMRPRDATASRYFHELLRTPGFSKEAERWSYGITSDMWSLRPEHFRMIYSTYPPPDEQAAIVKYLDHVDRKINRYIRAKKKLIALLNEQKQAIIHRAITRGLDPSVKFKPSGVEWLGDVPAHWEVKPARFVWRAVTRRDRMETDRKFSVTQKRGLVPTDEMEENSTQAESTESFILCHPGDLVLNKYKAHLGVFWGARERGIITPNYTVFAPLGHAEAGYFEHLFHTQIYRERFAVIVYGVTEGMSPLYSKDFYKIPLIVPPHSEQQDILRRIATSASSIDRNISRIEREIALIGEFRTRLVADVVTGKLDVREAAEKLPDRAEDEAAEVLDDETGTDADETTDDAAAEAAE